MITREENLLVVDWDYFFPNPFDGGDFEVRDVMLYDWTHKETDFYINQLWKDRALGFLQNDLELPRVSGYRGFWDRFSFADHTKLLVGDSNLHSGELLPHTADAFESVWLFDAHHDCGYRVKSWEDWRKQEFFDCEDWMLLHAEKHTKLHVRYPTWKIYAFNAEKEPFVKSLDRQFDDGTTPPVTFDQVYLCRSGAWVPSWCDQEFAEFIGQFPGEVERVDDKPLIREFSEENARREAEQMKAAYATLAKLTGQGDR